MNNINIKDIERQAALLEQQKRVETEKQQRVALEVQKRVEEGRSKMAQALEMRRLEDERKHALEISKKLNEADTTKQALLGFQRDVTQEVQNRFQIMNGTDRSSSSDFSFLPRPPISAQHHSSITTAAANTNTNTASTTITDNSAISINVSKARKVDYL